MTFRCTYCDRYLPVARRSIEHPLGQAIGGSGWSTRDVCDECNAKAGKEVDKPFASETIVLALRNRHSVPDTRGNVPPAPRLFGKLEENGLRAYLELGREGVRAGRVPEPEQRDENVERYTVDLGQAEALLRTREDRLRKKHGGNVKIEAHVEVVNRESIANISYSLDMLLWPRFGAKLGLAFGRQVLGEDWLSTPEAAHLRDVMWARESDPANLKCIWETIKPDDVFAWLVSPPQHMVAVQSTRHGAGLIVQLFGELRYGVRLSQGRSADVDWAIWVFDPVRGTCRETNLTDLVEEDMRRGSPISSAA
jgi:hypothetical protein